VTVWVILVVRRSHHFERIATPTLTGFVITRFFVGAKLRVFLNAVTHAIWMNWIPAYWTLLLTFHPWCCKQYLWTCIVVLTYVCDVPVHASKHFVTTCIVKTLLWIKFLLKNITILHTAVHESGPSPWIHDQINISDIWFLLKNHPVTWISHIYHQLKSEYTVACIAITTQWLWDGQL
jgi:hypothetical protein